MPQAVDGSTRPYKDILKVEFAEVARVHRPDSVIQNVSRINGLPSKAIYGGCSEVPSVAGAPG